MQTENLKENAEEYAKHFLTKYAESYSPERLRFHISNNTDIIRHLQTFKMGKSMLFFFKKLAGMHPEIGNRFTYDSVLELLETESPEKYRIIIDHPGGLQWIRNNVILIKNFIWDG